jgi:hypothetical protein
MVPGKAGRFYMDGALLPAMVYRDGKRTGRVYLLQECKQVSDCNLNMGAPFVSLSLFLVLTCVKMESSFF